MAIKEWTTHYPTSQDVLATDQPDLVNAVDDTRVSQIHALRDKLDAVAVAVGTDYPYAPSGCLRETAAALVDRHRMIYHHDVTFATMGPGYVAAYGGKMFINYDESPPGYIRCAITGVADASSGGHIRITISPTGEPGQGGTPVTFVATVTDAIRWYSNTYVWGSGMGRGWFGVAIEVESIDPGVTTVFMGLYLARTD